MFGKNMLENIRQNPKRFQFKIWVPGNDTLMGVVNLDMNGQVDRMTDQYGNVGYYKPGSAKSVIIANTCMRDMDGQDLWEYDAVKVIDTYRTNQQGYICFANGCWIIRFADANEQGQVMEMLDPMASKVQRLGSLFEL